jgi:hypothetical protein
MSKIDFKKTLKHLHNPSRREFAVVDVPPMQFPIIDGHGDPNTAQEYKDAVEALNAVAFRAKYISKRELARDYVVPRWRACSGRRTWWPSPPGETRMPGTG